MPLFAVVLELRDDGTQTTTLYGAARTARHHFEVEQDRHQLHPVAVVSSLMHSTPPTTMSHTSAARLMSDAACAELHTRTRWHRYSVAFVLRDSFLPASRGRIRRHFRAVATRTIAHHRTRLSPSASSRYGSTATRKNCSGSARRVASLPRMLCLHIPRAALVPTCSSTPACTSAAGAPDAPTTARAADPGRRAAPGHHGSSPESRGSRPPRCT